MLFLLSHLQSVEKGGRKICQREAKMYRHTLTANRSLIIMLIRTIKTTMHIVQTKTTMQTNVILTIGNIITAKINN